MRAAAFVGAALVAAWLAAPAAAALPEHVPGEVLLKLKRTATTAEASSLLETLGGERVDHPRAHGMLHLKGTRLSVEQAIERFRSSPLVEWIEPNYVWRASAAPNDPHFPHQWGLHNTGQNGGRPGVDVRAVLAWDRDTASTVLVAVIDTGVDLTHPDLIANVFTNPGEIPDNAVDDDFNGYVDDVHGWDFVGDDANPDDAHGHGTHCSGVIGARGNNGIGTAGVAWRVSILPARFLDASGNGTTAAAIDAIEYSVAMGARVLNNSWGGAGDSEALFEAVSRANDAGVLFVAAAGNGGRNTDTTPNYPSNWGTRLANVVSVAATDASDELGSFSNWGATTVHLAAPGVNVLSTWRDGTYEFVSGTSMSTPHVSGALALLIGRYPGLGAGASRDLLLARAEPVPALAGRMVSGGRLNLARLLSDPDVIPPGAIGDLTATPSLTTNSVVLRWSAVGDDGGAGRANRYEIRYAAVPEPDFLWDAAQTAHSAPEPSLPGSPEQATVNGLPHGSIVTFEVRAVDEFGNIGLPSLRAAVRTVDPPVLVASEDTLRFALRSGESETRTYTIRNDGASDLVVDLEFDRGAVPTTPMRVLLLHSAGTVVEMQSILRDLPLIERVDAFNARLGTPTAAELRFYDVVLLSSAQSFANPSAVGDALAEFVDAGGGAIITIGTFVTGRAVSGRFRTDGYLPFLSTTDLASGTSLGDFDRTHPIMRDVVDVTTTQHAFCEAAPDAKVVALWRTGIPFAVTRTRSVVGLNAYFGATAAWDLEMPLVVYNAAQWVRASGNWLTGGRSHMVIPAGGHVDVDLVCSAVPRNEGRYGSTLRLISNDPARPVLNAGAVLDITGTPGFSFIGTMQPDDSLLVGETKRDTVSVFNPGTSPVDIHVSSDDPRFTVSLTDVLLRPGERLPLIVTFRSDGPGSFTGRITVQPGRGLPAATVTATRHAVYAPRLEIVSAPPDLESDAGGHVMAELTLRNGGGAPLAFHVNIDGEPDAAERPTLTAADGGAPVLSRATPVALDAADLTSSGVARTVRVGPTAPGSDPGDAASALAPPVDDLEHGVDEPIDRRGRTRMDAAPNALPAPGVETFGAKSLLFSGTVRWRGNAYACTRDMTLHEHRFYMATSVPTDLWFAVYESPTRTGAFRLISVSRTQRSPVGEGWFSSGDVDVPLRAGFHYMILTQFRLPVRFWGKGGLLPFPIPASFGSLTAPVGFNWSPTATVPPDSMMDVPGLLYGPSVAYYQSLVTGYPAPWLTASPRRGLIMPGTTATVSLDADLTQAVDGTLAARVVLDSDDPAQPHTEVPVRIRVHGLPRLAVDAAAFDFGDVIIGETRSATLTVSNPGSALLEVSGITSGSPALSVSPASLQIAPRAQAQVSVRLAPTTGGLFQTAIEIRSNDATQPLVSVPVTARALPPPRLAVTPADVAATVAPGTIGSTEFVVENAGESPLLWAFVRGAGGSALPPTGLKLGHDLESVRSNLDANAREIRDAVPKSVDFIGGESGSQIDGGLFLGGNQIMTDLGSSPLPYTGGGLEPGDEWFGAGSRYATLKRPGVFMLIADLAGADVLMTAGQVLTSATQADVGSFDWDRFGVSWRGLYKRTWGGPGPAVTRLVLVPDAPEVVLTAPPEAHADLIEVTGLSEASRIVALLFAHEPGTLATAEQLVSVAIAALDAAGLPPPWLSLDPGSGTVPVGGRVTVRATLDASLLSSGAVAASLAIASNAPNQAPSPVTIAMRVAQSVTGRLALDRSLLLKPGRPGRVNATLVMPSGVPTSALVRGSLRIAGVVPTIRDIRGTRIHLGVDRVALAAALPVGSHVPVLCTAELTDGRLLEATDHLRVRARHPRDGDADDGGNRDGGWDDDADDESELDDVALVETDALLAMPANPVRAPAGIRFRLGTPGSVNAALYDATGRRARTFATGVWSAGTHTLTWDGRDEGGHALSPGVYFVRIEAGTIRETARWVLLR